MVVALSMTSSMPSAWAMAPNPLRPGRELVRRGDRVGVRVALAVHVGLGDPGPPLRRGRLLAGLLELVPRAVPRLGGLRGPHRGLLEPLVGKRPGRPARRRRRVPCRGPRPSPPSRPDGTERWCRRRWRYRRPTSTRWRRLSPVLGLATERLLVIRGCASSDFPIARGTRSTLVRSSHKGNTFPNFPTRYRRVDLTNYKDVILGSSKRAASTGAQSASMGTADVVVVGWDDSPCLSNFWPVATPPT